MNKNGPAIQEKADMIRFMCSHFVPLVRVEDNIESHLVALLAIMANPDSYIIVPDDMKDSIHFFNMYNVVTHSPGIEPRTYIELGSAIKDGEKGTLAFHPLDSMTLEEVEEWYLDLEYANILPY